MRRRGFILYEGPSLFDGTPIVVICTFKTVNDKTGKKVLQTWIIRQDIAPHVAAKNGGDAAICGTCAYRLAPGRPRTCYVVPYQAPLSVYRSYQAGKYHTTFDPRWMKGRVLRIGSYGDPCAVPFDAWRPVIEAAQAAKMEQKSRSGSGSGSGSGEHAGGVLGYTHAWRTADPSWKTWLMASVESEEEAAMAWLLGWRTFRGMVPGTAPVKRKEILCPSLQGLHCDRCRLCAGMSLPSAKSIALFVHGRGAKSAVRYGVVR